MRAKLSKLFDVFALIIYPQIATSKKPIIKISSSIETKLWRKWKVLTWVKKCVYNLKREISLKENKQEKWKYLIGARKVRKTSNNWKTLLSTKHISCKFVTCSFLFPLFEKGSVIGYLISEIRRKRYKISEIPGKYFKKIQVRTTFLI